MESKIENPSYSSESPDSDVVESAQGEPNPINTH